MHARLEGEPGLLALRRTRARKVDDVVAELAARLGVQGRRAPEALLPTARRRHARPAARRRARVGGAPRPLRHERSRDHPPGDDRNGRERDGLLPTRRQPSRGPDLASASFEMRVIRPVWWRATRRPTSATSWTACSSARGRAGSRQLVEPREKWPVVSTAPDVGVAHLEQEAVTGDYRVSARERDG